MKNNEDFQTDLQESNSMPSKTNTNVQSRLKVQQKYLQTDEQLEDEEMEDLELEDLPSDENGDQLHVPLAESVDLPEEQTKTRNNKTHSNLTSHPSDFFKKRRTRKSRRTAGAK